MERKPTLIERFAMWILQISFDYNCPDIEKALAEEIYEEDWRDYFGGENGYEEHREELLYGYIVGLIKLTK